MFEIIDHGRIREVRLAKPPVNALNTELAKLLTRSLSEAGAECGAVVLSGRQGMFCAGLDVVELMQLDLEGMTDFWGAFLKLLETIACSPVPVVTAITGHSPAGGALMCIVSDYRVMSRGDYFIGLNEARVGLIIPPLLQSAMVRLVGPRVAEQMLVAGSLLSPQDAYEIGFVDALETGYESTIQHAVKHCEKLLSLPQHSMLGNRAFARAHFIQEFADHTDASIASFVDTWFSDKAQVEIKKLITQIKGNK